MGEILSRLCALVANNWVVRGRVFIESRQEKTWMKDL